MYNEMDLGPASIFGIIVGCVALAVGGAVWCVCANRAISSLFQKEETEFVTHDEVTEVSA